MRGTDPLQHKTSGMAALASSLRNQQSKARVSPVFPLSDDGMTKLKPIEWICRIFLSEDKREPSRN